jgi:hypothetical protein
MVPFLQDLENRTKKKRMKKKRMKNKHYSRITSKVVVSTATKLSCPRKINPIQNAVIPAIQVNMARVKF